MDLLVQTPEGREFCIEIWYFATVQEIKEGIHKYHGFPVASQKLYFKGQLMEDHLDTEHYGLLHRSKVFLSLDMPSEFVPERPTVQPDPVNSAVPQLSSSLLPANRLNIMVQPKGGTNKIEIEVNQCDNVRELRMELTKQQMSLPAEGYSFIFKQNVMDEDRSFGWHDVRSGDTIEISAAASPPDPPLSIS